MKEFVKKYRYSGILLRELVKTDFKLRYNGSFLGILWSVMKPILLFAIMYVVFVHFLRFGAGVPHFAVSLLLAIVLWSFFSEATSQGMQAIVGRGDVLRKVKLPKYIVVVSATVSALINLAISLVVVLIFAVFNGVEFRPTLLLIIPLIIELYVFALSVALFLSALYVKFRDLSHIWEVILQAWMYATPIIYPLSMVTAINVTAAKVLLLPPIAQIIQDARWAVVSSETETVWNYLGNPWFMAMPFIIVVVVAVISVLYFKKNSRYFTELV
jgi:ABC-2 type transport system permease protein